MAGRNVSRREILRRAGAGAAVVGLAALENRELTEPVVAAQASPPTQAEHVHAHPPTVQAAQVEPLEGPRYGVFFNRSQMDTVEAIAERLMPGAAGKPGARDANVINYIDLALAGVYADQQDYYRRGLEALDAYSEQEHGQPFVRLDVEQQDVVLASLERGSASGFTWPTAQDFFSTLRIHTFEGMFSDPVYGGNRDFLGWRLIEFPGAQHFFLPSDLLSSGPYTRTPIIGIQAQAQQGGGQ